MSLTATFNAIQRFEPDDAASLLLAALDEQDENLQSFAAGALIDRRYAERIHELFRRFSSLPPKARDAVLEKKWLLDPIAKVIMGYGTPESKGALFDILPFLPVSDAVSILAGGLNDPSSNIRTRIWNELTERIREFITGRRQSKVASADVRAAEREEVIPRIVDVLSHVLAAYDDHRDDVFLEAVVECGEAAYPVVSSVALTKAYTPVYTALQKTLAENDTPPAVKILLRLSQEKESRLHGLAVEVFRRKQASSFIPALTGHLSGLESEPFAALARKFQQISWWKLVDEEAEIDLPAAETIIRFLLESNLDHDEKLQKIRRFLAMRDPAVRLRAFQVLKREKSRTLLDDCRTLVADGDDEVALAAIETVVELNPSDKNNILTPLLHSRSARVTRAVLSTISRDSFDRYMRSFDALDERTRELAAKAIAKIDAGMAERLAEEISALDPERRLKALRFIEFVDMEKEMGRELLDVIADPDRKVRATAIKILGVAGNARAIRSLIGALNDPDRRVRANAIEAFEDIGDARFAQILMPFTHDPDNRVRANAVKALWHLGVRDVREIVEGMLAADDVNMRLSAVWLIGEIAIPEGRAMLTKIFPTEADERVKAKIQEIVGGSET